MIITRHFGELPAQSAVQALLSGIMLLLLQLAINWHQLGVKVSAEVSWVKVSWPSTGTSSVQRSTLIGVRKSERL